LFSVFIHAAIQQRQGFIVIDKREKELDILTTSCHDKEQW
jgi:hypothetical protein